MNQEGAQRAGETVTFSFGRNWGQYLRSLDDTGIDSAAQSLQVSFDGAPLQGETFLDVGCGSGLFSYSAHRMGAVSISSVDVDPNSIACTKRLWELAGKPATWLVQRGSILDESFLERLRPSSRVFSWGVLHHTGAMWPAVENLLRLVAPGGLCCIALYNRPNHPRLMLALKRTYNRLPGLVKPVMKLAYGIALLSALLFLEHRNPARYVREYGRRARGMSFWRDVEDWLGGLPYEFADADQVVAFIAARGFHVERVTVRSPSGNNEYLARRL